MVRDEAGITDTAFDGSLAPAAYHAGPAEEEALARLEWLVTRRQRCGLVVADEGLGKSHLLAAATRRLGGLGAEVVLLSLGGLPDGEWLELLLDRLPLDPASRAEPLRPWQKLENRLRENALLERTTVLLCDDVDAAAPDARAGLARLAAAAEPRFAATVIVATAAPAGLVHVPAALQERAAVRIELAPWDEREVAEFLAAGLLRAGLAADAFSPAAAATLGRFAAGVPRAVCRLARLAVAAAAATVERVWRELTPQAAGLAGSADAGQDAAADDAAPPAEPPRVRVVRRLWG